MKKKSPSKKQKQTRSRSNNQSINRVKGGSINFAVTPTISPCSRNYIKCMTNPFGSFGNELPCIPDVISFPSFKFSAQARATFMIGAGGCGFVDARPYVFSNTTVAGHYSNADYLYTDYQRNHTVPEGVTTFVNDSPFQNVIAQQYRRFRTVGCGIQIRYIGTELNRGGRVLLVRSPGGVSISNNSTDSQLLTLRTTNTAPVTRREECVTYFPDTLDDLDYKGAEVTSESLLLFVSGAVPGSSFEFLVKWFYECIGNDIPATTKSHSDPTGLGAALSSIPAIVSKSTPAVAENNMLQKALSSLAGSFSGLMPTLARGAIGMGMNYMLGGPNPPLALMNSNPVVTEVD